MTKENRMNSNSGAISAQQLVGFFRQLEEEGGGPDAMFAGELNIPQAVLEESIDLKAAAC